MHRRRLLATTALVLAVIGMGVMIQGGYIYAKACLAQFLLEAAWEQALDAGRRIKPWPWADTWPVARLQAPEQDADLIVLAGDHGAALAFGPGHMSSTPAPGARGNSVISAHRDTHFTFLSHIRTDDPLRLQGPDGRWQRFRVTETRVVDSAHARIALENDVPALTLVTCYPFNALHPGGSLRYVVVAQKQ